MQLIPLLGPSVIFHASIIVINNITKHFKAWNKDLVVFLNVSISLIITTIFFFGGLRIIYLILKNSQQIFNFIMNFIF